MMNKLLTTFITVLSLVGLNGQSMANESDWNNVRDRNGIQVYNRSIEGSDFKEFMAQTTIDASLSTIISVFDDTPAGIEWVENVDEMHTEKRISDSETITVTLSKAPWPVADRDAVVMNHTSQDPDTFVVTLNQKGIPDYLPLKKGVVRVKRLNKPVGVHACYRFTDSCSLSGSHRSWR